MNNHSGHSIGGAPVARRGFLAAMGTITTGWIVAALYPVFRYLAPQAVPDPFAKTGKVAVEKITPADVLAPGMGRNGGYAGRGLIVLRDQTGTLRAFDSKCSHAGCNVSFQKDKLFCHCHGGTYDFNGKNIAGPPPRPLVELNVTEEKGILYVSRPAAPVPRTKEG